MLIYKLPLKVIPPPTAQEVEAKKKAFDAMNEKEKKAAIKKTNDAKKKADKEAIAKKKAEDEGIVDKPTDFSNVVSKSKLPFLEHKRCINMTFQQYRKRDHINDDMCCHEFECNMYDIEAEIIRNLDEIKKIITYPFKPSGVPLLPLPIYVSIAKIIEKDEKYVLKNMSPNGKTNLTDTFYTKYIFKGLMKIIIYIPNLMKNIKNATIYYNYYPSLCTYTNQNKWMEYMTDKDSYYLKSIDNKKKRDKAKYDNLLNRTLTNICDDFGCTANVGEDIEHIKDDFGGGVFMPTKCLQSKEYASKNYMNRDFTNLYFKENKEIAKIYEELKKEAEEEAQDDENELDDEEVDGISIDSASEALAKAGKDGKGGGKKINRTYNNNIRNDIKFRSEPGKNFPGIPEITFSMFKIKEDYPKFSNFFHYMPWGNKLLNFEYVLNSGTTFNFEDTKFLMKNVLAPVYIKFKSLDDNYYMDFDNEGVLTLYNNDGKPNTIIKAAYGKNLKNAKNRTIEFDVLNGLHIQGEPPENNDTIVIKYPGNKNIQPYSLILDTSPDNLGKLKIYDLGFNVIFNN